MVLMNVTIITEFPLIETVVRNTLRGLCSDIKVNSYPASRMKNRFSISSSQRLIQQDKHLIVFDLDSQFFDSGCAASMLRLKKVISSDTRVRRTIFISSISKDILSELSAEFVDLFLAKPFNGFQLRDFLTTNLKQIN